MLPRGYVPQPGEVRFDMFEAEFTHEGDRCTFEVLLDARRRPADPALRVIAEIVHDIDIKDGKFGRPETDGHPHRCSPRSARPATTSERLRRGAALFDDLYGYFRGQGR